MTSNKRFILTGGGTGGHIYPAIAVAEALKQDNDVEKIYFAGCKRNMEYNIALNEGLEFLDFDISGMPRKNPVKLFFWILNLIKSVILATITLQKIKPDVILGTGGYASAPSIIAGCLLKIPFIIHDPDAHPGIVNKIMASKANVVSTAFEQASKYLKSNNIILNGNPIRANFGNIDKVKALETLGFKKNKKIILVMGGSQGAKSINDAILGCIEELIIKYNYQVIHQTGKKNYEYYISELENKWKDYKNCSSYIVKPYFDYMATILASADIAISRAGSLSLSELNLNALPSILIPYPFAAANHQEYNAKAMENAGAAVFLDDKNCTPENLLKNITTILNNENKLQHMKEANIKLAKPNATKDLVALLKNIS
ncbi:MAG: undecaprenyldiphospho-muramoylpentapeptide beta-N-acetylglucosaminyltransferase [Candidatus Gastranaerophilales bacterium]|nr:undecaprenyldiphospho-muramoylpentapeptide beta-N-acetylglucosaminyltransferase [Candidatus Gastranaerophilales bacterium]